MTLHRITVAITATLIAAVLLGAPLWLLAPAVVAAALGVRMEERAPRPPHRLGGTRGRVRCACGFCSQLEVQITYEREKALLTHGVIERQRRRSELAALRALNEERYRLYSRVLDAIQDEWDHMAEILGL